MPQGLLSNSKITVVHAGDTALAATDIDCTSLVDMSGYENVFFITSVVESTAGGTTGTVLMVPRHASVNTSTTGITDLASTAQAGTTALTTSMWGEAVAVDVVRPTKRYMTVSLNKTGANTVQLGPCIAIAYNNAKGPVSQSTSETIQTKTLISPTT